MIDETKSNWALSQPVIKQGKSQGVTWRLHAQIVGTRSQDWSVKILNELGIKEITPEEYVKEYHRHMNLKNEGLELTEGAQELVDTFSKFGLLFSFNLHQNFVST